MEELFLIFAGCLLLGSGVYFYYYPVYTLITVLAVLAGTYRLVSKKQAQIAYREAQKNRLGLINKHTEIANVYLPDFEQTVEADIKVLKKELNKKGQTEVLSVLESMESMLNNKIIPRKQSLEESIDNYVNTNHLVLEDQIRHNRKKLDETDDERMKGVIESTIKNLEEKREIMESSKQEIIYFYSQLKNIIQQIENMRLKSGRLNDNAQLLLDVKHDLNQAFEGFSDANSLLDDLSKL